MDCREVTQPTVAMQIIQTPQDGRVQWLFKCIYALFQESFMRWILSKYNYSNKDKLWQDAKDAFQNGVMAFYLKVKQKRFQIKNSLKTTVYSFGLLQLLAVFKKEKHSHVPGDYLQRFALFLEDEQLEAERQELFDREETNLLKALQELSKLQRNVVMMRFFEQLSSKQIAERLDTTPGRVDNESAKAYRKLRSLLQAKQPFKTS